MLLKDDNDRIGYQSGGYNIQSEFIDSNDNFVTRMAKMSMEDTKRTKDRDKAVEAYIQDKVKVAKTLGLEDFTKEYYKNQIAEAMREMAKDKNPLLGTRQVRAKGGLLEDDREKYVIGGLSKFLSKAASKLKGKGSKSKPTQKELEDELRQLEYEMQELMEDNMNRPEGLVGARLDAVEEIKDLSNDIIKDLKKYYPDSNILKEIKRDQKAIGGIAKLLSKAAQKGIKEYGDLKAKIPNTSTAEKKEIMVDMLSEYGYSSKEIQDLLDDVYKKGNSDRMIKALNLENINEDLYVQRHGFHPYYEAMEVKNKKRNKKQEGGEMDNQMMMIMSKPTETEVEPDGEMEENYTDFIMSEALTEEEEDMLTQKLEQDEQLAMLFDKVIDVAQEFAGSGPVEGPGSGVSDSIPARLSDGEFVFTAKAVEEIGADELMRMMKDAEMKADERQQAYDGGLMNGELEKVVQTETRITKPADATSPALGATEDNLIQEEVTRNMLDPRVQHVRS